MSKICPKSNNSPKQVTFNMELNEIYFIENDKESRNGSFWIMDAMRFKRRSEMISQIVGPILQSNHRIKMRAYIKKNG